MISDIGDISAFSYFSTPGVYVGNQVQYTESPPEFKSLPEDNNAANEVLTPKVVVPVEEDRYFTSDEVYYPENETEPEEEVVFYYKDIEDPVSSTDDTSYLSYPSYPPLAPAPPKTPTKREQNGPVLVSSSAYTSTDLHDEPETLHTPDGETFYFVGEVEQGAQEVTLPTPSPVYYKYPSTTQTTTTTTPKPTSPKVVYYRQEEPTSTTQPSSGETYTLRRTDSPVSTTPHSPYTDTEPRKGSYSHISFGFPQNDKFEIPQEFRTFLNTPPKWINMENWK